MIPADNFTVTISSLNKGINDDPLSTSGHTLTITPDGRLTIESQNGHHILEAGQWDDLELKLLPRIEQIAVAEVG
jgi:hypothetical protein